MTERVTRAQTQIEEIVAAVGPREASSVLQVFSLLEQAERAVADCRKAAEAGIEPGTFRFTAELEDEKAQEFADHIASEWERLVGEDRDREDAE